MEGEVKRCLQGYEMVVARVMGSQSFKAHTKHRGLCESMFTREESNDQGGKNCQWWIAAHVIFGTSALAFSHLRI
jgi:hypothetical protein